MKLEIGDVGNLCNLLIQIIYRGQRHDGRAAQE